MRLILAPQPKWRKKLLNLSQRKRSQLIYAKSSQERLPKSNDPVKEEIIDSINSYGDNAEHNFYYFMNNEEPGTKNTFIDFGDNRIILANVESHVWNVFPSGILANEEDKPDLFKKFCQYCFKKNAKEVYAELDINLFKKIKLSGYLVSDIQFEYTWPVVDLTKFDPHLQGSGYYELRKIKNNFMKNNALDIVDAQKIQISVLKKILSCWESNRKSSDKAHSTEYDNWMKTNFEGADYAKCWIVNNAPNAIVVGWRIPNSKRFYLAVVLHNYQIKNIGEMIYLQTLLELKNLGYLECNLGGSDEKLLAFKRKFLPSSEYKTVEFYVRKKMK